jgi:plasmid pONE430 DNA, complete sequence
MKIIGKETYINQETGEINEMQVIDIEERDANFHKIWLKHILTSIDLIGNQKIKLAFWILDNMDSENQLIMSQREMARKNEISTKTVTQTLKILMEANFLQKINNSGAYRVNPNVLWKGGKSARMNVLFKYHQNEKIGKKE